jgi:hypothetical protein
MNSATAWNGLYLSPRSVFGLLSRLLSFKTSGCVKKQNLKLWDSYSFGARIQQPGTTLSRASGPKTPVTISLEKSAGKAVPSPYSSARDLE